MNDFILALAWYWQLAALFAVFALRAFIIAGGFTLWTRLSTWARSRQIVAGELSSQALRREISSGLTILLLDATVSVALIQLGLLRFRANANWQESLLTFFGMFVWVEIFFYYSHALFHRQELFWIHRDHHQGATLNPWTSLAFSFVERGVLLFGTVFIPAILSQWAPIAFGAYLGYFLFNYALNVFAHINVEILSPRYHGTIFGKIFNSTSYHTMHHQRYRGHYGLYTPFLDRLHSTRFADYEAVHRENYERGDAKKIS